MTSVLAVASEASNVSVLGTRFSAVRLRQQLEAVVNRGEPVQLDFGGLFVTQSFVDELLGPLALRIGPQLLNLVSFGGCSEDVKSVLRMVLSGRLRDFATLQAGGQLHNQDAGVEHAEAG